MRKNHAHIVNVSGGKDSTAVYLLALERRERNGMDFTPVFANTGNEHEHTYDYVRQLAIDRRTLARDARALLEIAEDFERLIQRFGSRLSRLDPEDARAWNEFAGRHLGRRYLIDEGYIRRAEQPRD